MASDLKSATHEWKDFLESTPAYVERRFEHLIQDVAPNSPGYTHGIFSPGIQLYCEIDDGVRWFDPIDPSVRCAENVDWFISYKCRDCGRWSKRFALILIPDKTSTANALSAMKLGEFPPFGSHLAKRFKDLLSQTDFELYRKGLRAEREGQGIGAAAYFRRVVDNQWKVLVRKLRDAAVKLGTAPEKLKVFDEALAQPQFSNAVDTLRDAIQPKLLILDGRNPLALLYKPLSVQIHELK